MINGETGQPDTGILLLTHLNGSFALVMDYLYYSNIAPAKILMEASQSIKKILGFLLLLLFTVSIGPRAYFHDLVADHRDGTGCMEKHKQAVFHKEEIECHFDDLVVSAPYIFNPELSSSITSVILIKNDCAELCAQYRVFLKNKESRGPPSVRLS